jgi:5,5'-dehydrodivanillate O-demethylase
LLTEEENDLLTRIGPGTLCGDLLRRYWHPIALTAELTEERPKRRLTVLGEELVLFRAADGTYGLVAEHCSHRGASLYYGFLEGDCIRCAYHGWVYDREGKIIETPFEPAQSLLKHTLRHPAYPVEELAGILFAYMGPPEKRPLLPRWDVLAWQNGHRRIDRRQTLDCNWVQAEENSADVTHTYFLHGHTMHLQGNSDGNYYYRPIEQYGFQRFEWGLLKSWRYRAGFGMGEERGGGNPLMFPNMLRVREGPVHALHWRVPIDDTHTEIFWAGFIRRSDTNGGDWNRGDNRGDETQVRGQDGDYSLNTFTSQDTMAWETQGPRFDRSREHLGAGDRGIALFRDMLKEQIEVVQRGGDPMALVHDPEKNTLIEIPDWVTEGEAPAVGTTPVAGSIDALFSGDHEIFEVPFGTARPQAGLAAGLGGRGLVSGPTRNPSP